MRDSVIGQVLGLLLVANGAPIIARNVLGKRGNWPLDFGSVFVDGRPLFGPAKTIRGLLAAIGATGCGSLLLGHGFLTGAYVGLYAMLGDLVSSFIKRRLGITSSDSAPGLDQGLEALLPVLAMQKRWGLNFSEILAIVVAFWLIDVALSRVLYKLHIRKQPW